MVMNKDRKYVENHHRHIREPGRYYLTVVCRLAHRGGHWTIPHDEQSEPV